LGYRKLVQQEYSRIKKSKEMQQMNILSVIVPGGTSLIQPCDTVVNKPFKNAVKLEAAKHCEENLDDWTTDKVTTSDRRILMILWVADAWDDVCKDEDEIRRSSTQELLLQSMEVKII
jgi:hypothetical protein